MMEQSFLHALESSALASSIRQSVWLYPTVEILHILGFAILVGAAILFDLRLVGFAKRIPVVDVAAYFKKWAFTSFMLVLISGGILFVINAVSLASNQAFILKMVLLLAAAINAVVFQLYSSKRMPQWNKDTPSPLPAKLAGIFSMILWVSILAAGRLIAYF